MSDLTRQELQILVRAYQANTTENSLTNAARKFADSGFGSIRGRKWMIYQPDRTRIREYLVRACGIPDPDSFDVSFSAMTRLEAAQHTEQEKYAGKRPRSGRVLLRAAGGTLHLNGKHVELIGTAALDIEVTEITSIEHDCLVMVENFEAFASAERTTLFGLPYSNPLYVYRGDNVSMPEAAKNFASIAGLPVVAFADFDPQGLNIAAATPNLVGAIFPVEYQHLNRNDLFVKQLSLLGATDKYPAPWQYLIETMKVSRRCMTQEHMITFGVPCQFFPTR